MSVMKRLGPIPFSILALPLLAWATEQYGSTSRLLVELKILLPGVATFLALFLMFDPDCLCSRLLCNTALRYTGIISYEWFLLHQPAQFQFHEWFGRSGGSLPRYLCTVLVPSLLTLALAALIYNKFSLPLIRAGRRRIQGG